MRRIDGERRSGTAYRIDREVRGDVHVLPHLRGEDDLRALHVGGAVLH